MAADVESKPSRQPPSGFDKIVASRRYIITVKERETAQEIEARIEREGAESRHQRTKDLIVTISVVVLIALMTLYCFWIIVHPRDFPAEIQKWASTTLTAIVSASVGYAIRGKQVKPD